MNHKSNLTIYTIVFLISALIISGIILGNQDLNIKVIKKKIIIDQNKS